jgi:5-methylcytosine-specific restriction endonuclease McrA
MDTDKVLVLNNSFEPLHVCSARRAIILLFAGKAERVEDTGKVIRSPTVVFIIPAVIRLHRYVRRPPSAAISFNKRNILKRDVHTCQYCGRNGGDPMTIDHVVPRSLGGRTVWENVVSACRDCNLRKGNKTLQEARMTLLRKPAKPSSVFYLGIMAHSPQRVVAWSKYLPREARVDLRHPRS